MRPLLVLALICLAGCRSAPPPSDVPLYHDVGVVHRTVTTSSPEAQLWFDRGLGLAYGFNHEEAIACFERALAADPDCAMCSWGKAYALGPNYNNVEMEDEASRAASEAVQQAVATMGDGTEAEQALIGGAQHPLRVACSGRPRGAGTGLRRGDARGLAGVSRRRRRGCVDRRGSHDAAAVAALEPRRGAGPGDPGDPAGSRSRSGRLHNFHFVAYGAMFAGRREIALAAARELVTEIPDGLLAEWPDFLDVFVGTPYHVMVRFGLWDEILAEPEPAGELFAARSRFDAAWADSDTPIPGSCFCRTKPPESDG